jgi:hypothetical protein
MFDLAISGEREIGLRFEKFPDQAHDRLKEAMESLKGRLESGVKGDAPVREGKLQSEIGGQVYDDGDHLAAQVGVHAQGASDYGKDAALEYGAHGRAQVRAHEARLTHVFGRPAELEVTVSAHERQVDIEERRYLRGPFDAIREEALAEMRQALSEAIDDSGE